jgi:NAD(P)-binding Rossmann-like domain
MPDEVTTSFLHEHKHRDTMRFISHRKPKSLTSGLHIPSRAAGESRISFLVLQLLVVLLLSATLKVQGETDVDVDICVIGAGPSGIQAAYTAEAKGYSVAIFEKNNYVGGKTKRFDVVGDDLPPYMMGATLHTGSEPNSLDELIKKFDVKNQGITVPTTPTAWYDDATLVDYNFSYVRLAAELAIYVWKRCQLNKYLNGPEGYLSDYPEELNTMSTKEW